MTFRGFVQGLAAFVAAAVALYTGASHVFFNTVGAPGKAADRFSQLRPGLQIARFRRVLGDRHQLKNSSLIETLFITGQASSGLPTRHV